jgi:hypothetical protein
MDAITLKIEGDIIGKFDEALRELPEAEKHALYSAAAFLRDKGRESLISKLPKATQQNPKYKDTIADAVRFTKVDGATLKVHALGTQESGSGTYRARFFEEQTKDRYQKTWNGVKLKKKRFLGHVGPLHFFKPTMESNMGEAQNRMLRVMEKFLENIITK